MKEISYIGPVHAACVMSWVTLVGAFIAMLVFNFPILFAEGLNLGRLLVALYMPIGFAITAFFSVLVGCFNYNWVAAKWGGIKIELS